MIVTIKAEWQRDGRGMQCELVFEDPQRGTVTLPAILVIDDDVEMSASEVGCTDDRSRLHMPDSLSHQGHGRDVQL
ncbi:hypothetical protein ACPCTO_34990, partial [Streptomyces olivoreticuli]